MFNIDANSETTFQDAEYLYLRSEHSEKLQSNFKMHAKIHNWMIIPEFSEQYYAWWAYWFARYLVNGRWIAGEQCIAACEVVQEAYIKMLKEFDTFTSRVAASSYKMPHELAAETADTIGEQITMFKRERRINGPDEDDVLGAF